MPSNTIVRSAVLRLFGAWGSGFGTWEHSQADSFRLGFCFEFLDTWCTILGSETVNTRERHDHLAISVHVEGLFGLPLHSGGVEDTCPLGKGFQLLAVDEATPDRKRQRESADKRRLGIGEVSGNWGKQHGMDEFFRGGKG